jgi:mono/diheme cytochrome c family protein
MNSVLRKLTLICVLAPAAWAFDAAAGKAVYDAKCKTCHGADGNPPAFAKGMGAKPLNDAGIQAKSEADLKSEILKGVGKMKAVAIPDADAGNVAAYVKTIK